MNNEKIEIRASKTKIIPMLLGSGVFVYLGLQMILDSGWKSTMGSVGILAIAFFGFGFFLFIKQLIKNKPILIIDNEGVIYQGVYISKVSWKNIDKIYINKINISNRFSIFSIKQNFLNISVKDTDQYAENQKTMLENSLVKNNIKYSDGIISIPSFLLAISLKELLKILNKKLAEYNKQL